MNWKAKALRLAKKLGVEIVFSGQTPYYEITVIAPKGKTWSCCDIHELTSTQWTLEEPKIGERPDFENSPVTPVSECWHDIYDRMEYGVEDCDNPECDWCLGL